MKLTLQRQPSRLKQLAAEFPRVVVRTLDRLENFVEQELPRRFAHELNYYFQSSR